MMRCVQSALVIGLCIQIAPALSASDSERVPPPMGFTMFCAKHPAECARRSGAQRPGDRLALVAQWHELNEINTTVNASIAPEADAADFINIDWHIFPREGNCADYAVTKRHLLRDAGWPSSSLMLAEVVIRATGEHHLILIVKENGEYFALDNRRPAIVKLAQALKDYMFVRAELGETSRLWTRRLT